ARVLAFAGREPRLQSTRASAARGTLRLTSESENRVLGFDGLPAGAEWRMLDEHLCLTLPASSEVRRLRILIGEEPRMNLKDMETRLDAFISGWEPVPDL